MFGQANNGLFTFLHETEAETACDHITLNFEGQGGSSLQIFVHIIISDAISSTKKALLKYFGTKERRGKRVINAFIGHIHQSTSCCVYNENFNKQIVTLWRIAVKERIIYPGQ